MTNSETKNYYETLGVAESAPTEEIRKAYLKLAHKYHPDKTGGDKAAEEKLKEINAAYDTLKNDEKRKQYDQMLKMGAAGGAGFEGFGGFGGGASPGGFQYDYSGADFGGFEDLFGNIFGGARTAQRRRGPAPGADLETRVTVTLQEVANGAKKNVVVRREETCSTCAGSGAAPGTQPETCPACGGNGQVIQQKGAFSVRTSCTHCHGTGRVVKTPCGACGGRGKTSAERTLSINIPAGVESGARLRLAGQGEAGAQGGPAGDLSVEIQVARDDFFTRRGADLECEVPVTVVEAALGGKVRVPTLSGVAELSVPEGTQSGGQLRMRGQGLPRAGGGKGDQIVKLNVEVPVKLTARQRELLAELAKEAGEEQFPKKRGFMEWLKRRG